MPVTYQTLAVVPLYFSCAWTSYAEGGLKVISISDTFQGRIRMFYYV